MKIKLVIDGEEKRVRLMPETQADKMILEFVDECDSADLTTSRDNSVYSDKKIKYIDLIMKVAPELLPKP